MAKKMAATKRKSSAKADASSPVTFEQLRNRVIEGTIDEDELKQYFTLVPNEEGSLEPHFQLNPAMVIVPPEEATLESAQLMNTANAWCYLMRKNAYYRRIHMPGGNKLIRVMAEGDSWFQYPFILHDVIDHIADRKDVAVRCFSAAGDVLSNMVARPQFLESIRTERPKYFLLSGGGNDLVDGAGLRKLLKPFDPALKPGDYPNEEYIAFKARLVRLYKEIIDLIFREDPTIHIICHGYSYAIPNSKRGPWLGKPMEDIGIKDRALQLQIMTIIVDDINTAIDDVAREARKAKVTVSFLDNRKLVPADGWHNEFHPNSKWFGKVAETFNALIK